MENKDKKVTEDFKKYAHEITGEWMNKNIPKTNKEELPQKYYDGMVAMGTLIGSGIVSRYINVDK